MKEKEKERGRESRAGTSFQLFEVDCMVELVFGNRTSEEIEPCTEEASFPHAFKLITNKKLNEMLSVKMSSSV